MVPFDFPGFLISAVIVAVGIWGWSAERKFQRYLSPADRLWAITLGWIINLCLLFFCIVFTFRLYTTPSIFALILSVLAVFLIVLFIYLYVRWKVSHKLIGREAKKSVESLRSELEKIAKKAHDDGSSSSKGGNEQ
ncbi:hypothetical protein J7K50_05345 [bacterium]|nr:hypothetical protein [bacterium]